jgi:hypothetical protein
MIFLQFYLLYIECRLLLYRLSAHFLPIMTRRGCINKKNLIKLVKIFMKLKIGLMQELWLCLLQNNCIKFIRIRLINFIKLLKCHEKKTLNEYNLWKQNRISPSNFFIGLLFWRASTFTYSWMYYVFLILLVYERAERKV